MVEGEGKGEGGDGCCGGGGPDLLRLASRALSAGTGGGVVRDGFVCVLCVCVCVCVCDG